MNNGITIRYDDKILLASGSLLTFGLGKTSFDLSYKEDRLTVVFDFIDSSDLSAKRARSTEVEHNEVTLKFENYRNAGFGITNIRPLELGTIADYPLWLRYRIVAVPGTDVGTAHSQTKVLEYSFYIGTEVARGND
jgi:hypothetical protein